MCVFFKALRNAAELLLPRTCTVCGRILGCDEKYVCTYCRSSFPFTHFAGRLENPMSLKFNAAIGGFQPVDEPFEKAAALFFYGLESNFRNITMDLKYNASLSEGRYFARELGRQLGASPLFAQAAVLVPVPLHPLRRFRRGYNQAEVIAREIGAACPWMTVLPLLKRTRRTRSQATMSTAQKKANVKDAFSVDEALVQLLLDNPEAAPQELIIVDDVFTTGATTAQCWKTLREKFPPSVKISVVTLGFVG